MAVSNLSNGIPVAFAVVAVALVVYPGPVADYVKGQQNVKKEGPGEEGARSVWTIADLLRIVHLTGFATTFGAALWLSFIGGVIMFKLSSVSIGCNIAILSVLHPLASSTVWEKVQIGALGFALLFNLANLLVLEPITTKLMRERHRAEKEDGISTEPGVVRKKEIEKAGPKLRAINKKFGAAHGISSLINLFAFWGLFVHVVYLAGRLSL